MKKLTAWEFRRKLIELAHKRGLIDYPEIASAKINSYGSIIEGSSEITWRIPEHGVNWKKLNESIPDYYGKKSPEEVLNDLFGYHWTADHWRTGKNLRGETYHAWLSELVEKFDLDYPTLNRFFEEIKRSHAEENNLNFHNLSNEAYIAITKRVEEVIEKWYPTYPAKMLRRRGEVVEGRDWIETMLRWTLITCFGVIILMIIVAGFYAIDMLLGGF